jgi:hypothetical protein
MRAARAALVTVAVAAAAGCGAKTPPDQLHTPGVTPQSSPGVATPAPTPTPAGKPVTRAEIAVIRGWSEALLHGKVEEATRYFAVPATIENDPTGAKLVLKARRDVRQFNRTLPCGAKLRRWVRAPRHFVIATFMLADRPGGRCVVTGNGLAAVAFLIRHGRIEQWLRVNVPPAAGSNDQVA